MESIRCTTGKPMGIAGSAAPRWPVACPGALGFARYSVVMVHDDGTNRGTVRSTGLFGGGSG